LKKYNNLVVQGAFTQGSCFIWKNMLVQRISTLPSVVYPPISHWILMALYIPSFYLPRGGGQLKLLCRVYARME